MKAGSAAVMATSTEAKHTALAAGTAVDHRAKAKVAADIAVRLAAWGVAKGVVPVDAGKAGVQVVDAGCSVRAT